MTREVFYREICDNMTMAADESGKAYFAYGKEATDYLKQKDPALGEAIEKIGHVRCEIVPDLFAAMVFIIIGQQISIAAQETVWQRLKAKLGDITPETVLRGGAEAVQSCGTSFKKAEYICGFAAQVHAGEFDIHALHEMSDKDVIAALSAVRGIGEWTAEMLMLFSMNRMDVFSFGDIAIHRGLRMLYHHRRVDRKLFEKYRRRYAPYGSVASLYIWEIACGAIPGKKDYAPKGG